MKKLFILFFALVITGAVSYRTIFTEVKYVSDSSAAGSAQSQASDSGAQNRDTYASASPSTAGTEKNTHSEVTKYAVTLHPDASTFTTQSGEIYPIQQYKPLAVNDPAGTQWWNSSTGLETAWTIGSGPRQTSVAVIDTGFALKHEEFEGRWAVNTGESGSAASENPSRRNCTDRGLVLSKNCNLIDDDYDGILDNEFGTTFRENPSRLNCTDKALPLDKSCNLIDDDGNGYADDVSGWDFANSDPSVQAGETNQDGSGTQHGTAVAGILAASGNNNKGIAGVNWSTKILPLQALDDDSSGNTLTVGRAVYYAAERGVDVISLSVGSDAADPYLRQAIQYALDRNIIVVAASGNDGCDCILYPARYPEVVAVGAQGQSGSAAGFSSYGSQLDILAPGHNMTTTGWTKNNPESSYSTGVSGTSFAAPYVSGLLSLARSHQPNATWGELLNTLLSSADHGSRTSLNPFSSQTGFGFARAGSYITRAITPASPLIRYVFGPTPIKGGLSSSLVYQCHEPTDFPTATLYEITSGSTTFYTIDQLEHARATARGDTIKSIGYSCVGLPTDIPNTTRNINLLREI